MAFNRIWSWSNEIFATYFLRLQKVPELHFLNIFKCLLKYVLRRRNFCCLNCVWPTAFCFPFYNKPIAPQEFIFGKRQKTLHLFDLHRFHIHTLCSSPFKLRPVFFHYILPLNIKMDFMLVHFELVVLKSSIYYVEELGTVLVFAVAVGNSCPSLDFWHLHPEMELGFYRVVMILGLCFWLCWEI